MVDLLLGDVLCAVIDASLVRRVMMGENWNKLAE
jgi:hypothetical protein